jgi:ubiquinone/menaquinone biosynthesis C-methylase UbiE
VRRLEIGPGGQPLPGFEGLDILKRPGVQHVGDAANPPFADATFDEVYSSHCIEHLNWFEVEAAITQWVRILKPGGLLEVHTLDATRWMRVLIEFEETGETSVKAGKWRADLHGYDPYTYAVGRIMCYAKKGDGGANLHRAIITPRYLRRCFERAGLVAIQTALEPRGERKHRMVNCGLTGRKPI